MKALLGEYAGKGYVMRRCKRAVEVIRYMGLFEKIVNDCRLKSCVLFEGDVLLRKEVLERRIGPSKTKFSKKILRNVSQISRPFKLS